MPQHYRNNAWPRLACYTTSHPAPANQSTQKLGYASQPAGLGFGGGGLFATGGGTLFSGGGGGGNRLGGGGNRLGGGGNRLGGGGNRLGGGGFWPAATLLAQEQTPWVYFLAMLVGGLGAAALL